MSSERSDAPYSACSIKYQVSVKYSMSMSISNSIGRSLTPLRALHALRALRTPHTSHASHVTRLTRTSQALGHNGLLVHLHEHQGQESGEAGVDQQRAGRR